MPPFLHHDSTESPSLRHYLSLRSFVRSITSLRLTPRLLSSSSSQFTKPSLLTQPISRSLANVLRRSSQVDPNILPTTYSGIDAGPPPGTVVGIVLGSVGGFLLLLWLIYTCFGMDSYQSAVYEEEIVRRRSHSPRRTASRSRSEVIEVSRHRSPQRREVRRETVIVEETRRAPPEDDIVEVIEEHSPVRQSGRGERRDEFYRHVNPNEFGGGRGPTRKVSRR